MEIGFVFWLIMLLTILFWGWGTWGAAGSYWPMGHGLLIFILLFLLGWKVFGFAIHT